MREVNVERVLLVEQPDGRDMLKIGLEAAGFEVDLADDAETALTHRHGPRAGCRHHRDQPAEDGWLGARAAAPTALWVADSPHRLDEPRRP